MEEVEDDDVVVEAVVSVKELALEVLVVEAVVVEAVVVVVVEEAEEEAHEGAAPQLVASTCLSEESWTISSPFSSMSQAVLTGYMAELAWLRVRMPCIVAMFL